MIRKKLQELQNLPIIRNILVLGGGTGLAQLFPIISAPIVTRLYQPEHFGTYAIYYAISTFIYGFSTLDYHNVIIVSDTKEKAFSGIILSASLAIIISTLLSLFFFLIPYEFLVQVIGDKVIQFTLIIPLTVLLSVSNTLLYSWFLRIGDYAFISKNKILLAACSVVLQISIGLLQIGALGFILANLAATTLAVVLMLIKFNKEHKNLYLTFEFSSLKKVAIEFKKFSLISVWANSLNIFTLQLPDLLINKFFGSYVLGQYSLAQRMVTLPSSFVASSVQEVFRQTAAKENRETGSYKKAYSNIFKITAVLALLLLIASLTIIPPAFIWVFGDKWVDAGVYVKSLCLLFAIRFIAPPLSYSFYLSNKQQYDFYWQIGLFIVSSFALYGGYYYYGFTNPTILLFFYSILVCVWYLFNLFLTYRIVFKKHSITYE